MQPDLFGVELCATVTRDFRVTPAWFTAPICRWAWPAGKRLLDAGAGLGDLGRAVEQWCADRALPLPRITAVELHPDRLAACPERWERVYGDLLGLQQQEPWPLILSNPPFSAWYTWVEHCLRLLAPEGQLFAVAPWEYVSRRRGWWQEHPERRLYRCARRPWPESLREICWVEWVGGAPPVRSETEWLEV